MMDWKCVGVIILWFLIVAVALARGPWQGRQISDADSVVFEQLDSISFRACPWKQMGTGPGLASKNGETPLCSATECYHDPGIGPNEANYEDLAFSGNGKFFGALKGGTLRIWGLPMRGRLGDFSLNSSKIRCFDFSRSEDRFATTDEEGNIVIVAMKGFEVLSRIRTNKTQATKMFFGENDRAIVLADSSSVTVFDITSGKEVLRIMKPSVKVSSLTQGPNGMIVFCETRRDAQPIIVLYSLTTRTVVELLKPEFRPSRATFLILAMDRANLVLSSEDCIVRIWEIRDHRVSSTLKGYLEGARGSLFVRDPFVLCSPDGSRVIAWGQFDLVHQWNAKTGRRLKSIVVPSIGHDWIPRANVVCSPDSKYLAVSGHDGQVHFFDISTASESFQLK